MFIKKHTVLALLSITALAVSCKKEVEEVSPSTDVVTESSSAATFTGNGSLSGAHYQVNIIGVPKGKSADMTGGSRIFVPLTGTCKIMLKQGSFAVLDANGTDGIAQFQLPSPDADNDGVTNYSVFARPLGTPGGTSTTTTCATDPLTGKVVCSNSSYVAVRNTGKTSFTNVSAQLLYVYADLDGDGTAERYPLFDERLQDYFWQYDNNGMKVLQLRFYEIATNVN
ncbi:MAG TPA: hypothetical protein VL947_11580, partial [Cytophagales bacterium]|nr:hypothetical protein [Cytophagales bacterium]